MKSRFGNSKKDKNMKKRLIIPLTIILACMAFASCGSKLCYCYEGNREAELYVSEDVACNAYSTDRRGCVESYERMTNRMGGIGDEYKKAKAQE